MYSPGHITGWLKNWKRIVCWVNFEGFPLQSDSQRVRCVGGEFSHTVFLHLANPAPRHIKWGTQRSVVLLHSTVLRLNFVLGILIVKTKVSHYICEHAWIRLECELYAYHVKDNCWCYLRMTFPLSTVCTCMVLFQASTYSRSRVNTQELSFSTQAPSPASSVNTIGRHVISIQNKCSHAQEWWQLMIEHPWRDHRN